MNQEWNFEKAPGRALLAILLLLVLGATALAQALLPAEFTREFARALTAALPTATVTIKGDLHLGVRDTDGTDRDISLNNAYRDYAHDPTRFGDLVQAFAAAMTRSREPAKLDPANIVPVIKDKQWLADLQRTLKERGTPQEWAHEPFNNELVIVYAEDDKTSTRYLGASEVAGIERKELRALALDNLRRILPRIQVHDRGGFYIISAGGDYEASLLLIDEIWSGGSIKVDGDIVVAIPARDALLATGSRNRSALRAIRQAAAKLAAEDPHGLTGTLFVYRNGRFTKFGR
jgi:uncharacterized protein YtpQ (UPF0354 family)